MKKIHLIAIIFAGLLTQTLFADDHDGLKIVCQNRDIGPVVGGNFLKHQEYLVKEGIKGKRPGSGLFNISVGKDCTFEDCYPLFNLFPVVTVMTKDGEEHVSTKVKTTIHEDDVPFQARHKHALGLPGTSIEIDFPDIDPKDVALVTVALYTQKYGFTSGGGHVWVTNGLHNPLSDEIAFRPKGADTIYAQFSWPVTEPYKGEAHMAPTIIDVKLAGREFYPICDLKLDSQWKINLGLHTDLNDGKRTEACWCYPTRNFNKTSLGRGKKIADVMNMGDAFDTWAGHPVTHSIYE